MAEGEEIESSSETAESTLVAEMARGGETERGDGDDMQGAYTGRLPVRTRFSPNALRLPCLIQSLTKQAIRRPAP